MVKRSDYYVMTYQCAVTNRDPTLVLKMTTTVDKHAVTNLNIQTKVSMKRWKHAKAVARCRTNEICKKFAHLIGRIYAPFNCTVRRSARCAPAWSTSASAVPGTIDSLAVRWARNSLNTASLTPISSAAFAHNVLSKIPLKEQLHVIPRNSVIMPMPSRSVCTAPGTTSEIFIVACAVVRESIFAHIERVGLIPMHHHNGIFDLAGIAERSAG